MSQTSEPTFWYKILDAPPPEPLPDTLPSTPLDASDGFIHLSSASQVPITANLFFSQADRLWVLKLRTKDLDGRVEYPPELGSAAPHLHGSKKGLGKGNIEQVIEMRRNGEGREWKDVAEMKALQK